jgi:hypothetical protein
LRPKEKVYRAFDGGCGGLYVEVSPLGTKSWRFRHTLNGKARHKSLGQYPLVGLRMARDLANDYRLRVKCYSWVILS